MKISQKTSKNRLQTRLQQHNRVWDHILLQNGPLGSPRQVLEPPQAAPREPKGVSRQPLWLPWAPLVSLWLSLGTAWVPPRAILGAWKRQMFGFRRFWHPNFHSKSKICQACFWSLVSCLALDLCFHTSLLLWISLLLSSWVGDVQASYPWLFLAFWSLTLNDKDIMRTHDLQTICLESKLIPTLMQMTWESTTDTWCWTNAHSSLMCACKQFD